MAESDTIVSNASSEVAKRIRSARARVGLTRKQLAAASYASERYLATLEAGTGNPTVDKLLAIAEALNIAPAELLPAGGERNVEMAKLFTQLRRMPAERINEAMHQLDRSVSQSGDKAGRIALIGLRGAGKSSLGQALAGRLGIPFLEISKEVERRYGGSITVMMEINGPAALRRYEAEVLAEIVSRQEAVVIAAPGAIVSSGELFGELLQSAWTVWLEALPDDHMRRVVAQGDIRPIAGNRAAMNDLKSILAAREADYARADFRLNTSAQDFESTLDLLEAAARSRT